MVLSAAASPWPLLCTKPPYPVAPLLSDQLIGVAKAHAEHRLKNLVAECRSKALDIPSVDTPCALHSRTQENSTYDKKPPGSVRMYGKIQGSLAARNLGRPGENHKETM